MTHPQAQRRAAALNHDHPERDATRWHVRECANGYEVVRMRLPAGMRIDPLRATSEAQPRPRQAPDPRPTFIRNVGGPYSL